MGSEIILKGLIVEGFFACLLQLRYDLGEKEQKKLSTHLLQSYSENFMLKSHYSSFLPTLNMNFCFL